MKAEKKAAEKEAKVKEQAEIKTESNDKGAENACGLDEETLDPNVRFLYSHSSLLIKPVLFVCLLLKNCCPFPCNIAILQDPHSGYSGTEGYSRGSVPTQVSCRPVTYRVH